MSQCVLLLYPLVVILRRACVCDKVRIAFTWPPLQSSQYLPCQTSHQDGRNENRREWRHGTSTNGQQIESLCQVSAIDDYKNLHQLPIKRSSTFLFSFMASPKVPNIMEILREARKSLRPWAEFINWNNFKTAANIHRLSNRILRNVLYFQSNYMCVFLGLFIYCLITSPLILIVIGCALYVCYKLKQKNQSVTVFQREVNTNQQCIAVHCATLPVLYLAGAGAVMFWVIGASFFFISIHAMFYNIDAIVTEESEVPFLSEVI